MAPPGFSAEAVQLAQVHMGLTTVLLTIAILILGVRLYLKSKGTWRLDLGDYFMTVGVCLAVVDYALIMHQAIMTANPEAPAPETRISSSKYSFIAIPIWSLAMACIKVSVCVTLLRIQDRRWWKLFIYFLMAVVVAYGVGNTVFILLECRPLPAAWDKEHNPGAQCLPGSAITNASNIGSGLSIGTDVLLSLAPISFLWNLKRPLRERIVVFFLMGLGLFAAVCSMMKLIVVGSFTKPNADRGYLGMGISFWTIMEQLVGIIAGCTPFLKPLFQRCLVRMGVDMTGQSKKSGYYNKNYPRAGYIRATPHSTFKSGVGSEEDQMAIQMEEGLNNKAVLRTREIQVEFEESDVGEGAGDPSWGRRDGHTWQLHHHAR